MKKRLLSILLCLVLALSLLPTAVLADASDVVLNVAGTNVMTQEESYWVVSGGITQSGATADNYQLKYTPADGDTPAVLTLKSASINGGSGIEDPDSGIFFGNTREGQDDKKKYLTDLQLIIHLIGKNTVTKDDGGDYRNAIFAGGPLTITAEDGASLEATASGGSGGNYGISVKQGLTIKGGTVHATGGDGNESAYNFGIYVENENCAISGATVTATAKDSSSTSYGIFCNTGKITVSNATVDATGGASGSSGGISAKGNLDITGSTVTAKSGAATDNSSGITCCSLNIQNSTVAATGGAATAQSCGIFINNTYVGSIYYCSSITGASTVTAAAGAGNPSYGVSMSKSHDTISFTSDSLTSGKSSEDNSLFIARGETAAFRYSYSQCLWPLQDDAMAEIFGLNDNNKLKLHGVNVKAKTADKYTAPAFFSFTHAYKCVVLENTDESKPFDESKVPKDICIAPVIDVEKSLSPAGTYGSPITVTAADFNAPAGATIVSIEGTDITNAGTLFDVAPALSGGSISYTPKSELSGIPVGTTARYLVGFDKTGDTTPEYYAFLTFKVKTEADLSAVSVSGLTEGHRTYDGTASTYTPIPVWDGKSDPIPALNSSERTYYTYTWQEQTAPNTYTDIANNAAPKNAGNYRLVTAVDESNPYYTGSKNIDFTIDKATITITAADERAMVGDAAPVLSAADCTVTGLTGGEALQTAPTVAYASAPDMTKAGTTAIIVSGAVAPAGDNYKIVYVNGTLTVRAKTKVDVTGVSVSGLTEGSRVYDGTASAYTGTPVATPSDGGTEVTIGEYTYTWQKTNDGNTYTDIANNVAPKNAGNYRLVVAVKEDNAGYTGSTNLDFTIKKATITITAADKNAMVGDAAPALSAADCTVTGLADGETLSAAPTVAYASTPDMTEAGTTAIIASGAVAPAGDNYKIDYVNGTLTVSARPSDSGGGSYTPPTPAPVVNAPQTSGGTTTVTTEVKPTVSSGTAAATIPAASIRKAADSAAEAAKTGETQAVVELKIATPDNISKVETTLPASGLETLAGSGAALTVSTSIGDVTFDSETLNAVVSAEENKTVQLSIETVKPEALTSSQKAVLGEKAQDAVIVDLNLTVGGAKVSELGGTVTISIPCPDMSAEQAANLVVWFLADDGSITPCQGSYNAETGKYEFQTGHFSTYVLTSFPFTDVSSDAWYYGDVASAYMNGLLTGTSDTTFSPALPASRGMVAAILYRMAKEPAVSGACPFGDVSGGSYYEKAISWAAENKIANGYSEKAFGPDDAITREQMLTLLYQYSAYLKTESFEVKPAYYPDSKDISTWAIAAVDWATANKIVKGFADGSLGPKETLTRAQAAAMITRFLSVAAN